ncbi:MULTISPECIES: methyltransferase [unclassified Nonomuraea]|uniref:methyltransferase n=1 Tax=unclassified Nonomuraea TaxID=2593643 RepID=UPI0033FFAA44
MTETAVPRREITTLADINRLGTAFCGAKAVLSAIELGLFTELSAGPATEAELCERLGLHPRAVPDFLSTLAALGLLDVKDDHYASTPAAARFLDRTSPSYGGGFLERANHMMYPAWENLTGLLRTGEPQVAGREDQAAAFERMMGDPDHLDRFLRMMDAVSGPLGPELAAKFDWANYTTVVDIGGARGNLLAHILNAHEHLSGYVFDLRGIESAFGTHMEALGLRDRARFVSGDFFKDALPQSDVLIIGHVLHDWSPAERAQLIRKAFGALQPGGALLIYDQLTGQGHGGDPWNEIISLNMQLLSPGGSEYTLTECRTWLRDAGFQSISTFTLGEHDTCVVALKDR